MKAELRIKNKDGQWVPLELAGTIKEGGPLKNLRLSVIGDSTLSVSDNCMNWLEKWGQFSPQNLSTPGTGFAAGDPTSNYRAKIKQISKTAQIIMIGVGFNDTRLGKPIGTEGDTGTGALAGYVNDFFEELVANFPATPIVCFSEGCTKDRHPGVKESDEWHDLIQRICFLRGIPFYRGLYDGSVMKPWIPENLSIYFRDNSHLNALGGKVMAKYLWPIIIDNVSPEICISEVFTEK